MIWYNVDFKTNDTQAKENLLIAWTKTLSTFLGKIWLSMQVVLFIVTRKHDFIWCKVSLLFIFALSWPYFREMWRGCRCRDVRGVTKQDFPPSNRCFPVLCIIFQVSREPFSSKYDLFRQCGRTLVIEPAQNSSADCSRIPVALPTPQDGY